MNYGYVAYKDKLNDEYREAFSRVEIYSNAHMIDAKTDSEWMMELMDNMLSAQEAGEPVEKAVGTDIDRFCEEFFSRYTGEDRVHGAFRRMYGLAKWLFVLEIIDGLFMLGEDSFFMGTSEVFSPFLWGVTIGILFNTVMLIIVNPLFLKKRKLSLKTYDRVVLILLILSFVVSAVTVNRVDEYFEVTMHRYILFAISGGYILIYMIVSAVSNYKKYGTVRAPKAPKVTMKDMINANLETEMPKEWLKEFEKKNRRRMKKGKPELTNEEFMEKLAKRYDYKRQMRANFLSVIGGGIGGVVLMMMLEGVFTVEGVKFFASGGDMITFFVLVLGCATLFALLFTKLCKPACVRFARLKQECNENGWTLAEYVENNCNKDDNG